MKKAIESNTDAGKILFNHFSPYTLNPTFRPIVRTIFKVYWSDIEELLIDVSKTYQTLIENRPDVKVLLDTPEGRRWLNYACYSTYCQVYQYTWT